jgi:hypothetical protein
MARYAVALQAALPVAFLGLPNDKTFEQHLRNTVSGVVWIGNKDDIHY